MAIFRRRPVALSMPRDQRRRHVEHRLLAIRRGGMQPSHLVFVLVGHDAIQPLGRRPRQPSRRARSRRFRVQPPPAPAPGTGPRNASTDTPSKRLRPMRDQAHPDRPEAHRSAPPGSASSTPADPPESAPTGRRACSASPPRRSVRSPAVSTASPTGTRPRCQAMPEQHGVHRLGIAEQPLRQPHAVQPDRPVAVGRLSRSSADAAPHRSTAPRCA